MRKILIVDDIPMMRELAAVFLARLGRVIPAADGEEALALVRRERPDVIVMDLGLPELDGAEVCRRLKRDPELARIPVLMLTASERAQDRERMILAGADDVLAKPIERAELLQAVQRFFRRPTPLGQPRVSVEAPVRVRQEDRECWGTVRNVSRGGLFVECSELAPPRSEVFVELRLPGLVRPLASTALVVWNRSPDARAKAGMGLRFLAMDGASARSLADYVRERAPASGADAFAASPGETA